MNVCVVCVICVLYVCVHLCIQVYSLMHAYYGIRGQGQMPSFVFLHLVFAEIFSYIMFFYIEFY